MAKSKFKAPEASSMLRTHKCRRHCTKFNHPGTAHLWNTAQLCAVHTWTRTKLYSRYHISRKCYKTQSLKEIYNLENFHHWPYSVPHFQGFLIFPACIIQLTPSYERFLTFIPKHTLILNRKGLSNVFEPGFSWIT